MADSIAPPVDATASGIGNGSARGDRGGRGRRSGGHRRGRGSGEFGASNEGRPHHDSEHNGRRGGRGGRGRGNDTGRGRNQHNQRGHQHRTPGLIAGNADGAEEDVEHSDLEPAQETDGASTAQVQKEAPEEGEDSDNICFICANPIQYNSIAACNHMTCHICALRMRALYKTKQCPHCRTNSDYVIFTTHDTKTWEEYSPKDIASQDEALGIKYERKHIRDDTLVLLRYNCPEPNCDVACLGWPDLHRHVKNSHHLLLCDLCSRFKKVFTHEHTLFTPADLRKHERYGDDVPGAENQSGFKGHPDCEFCRKRFYGDDELYAHCKEAHERCFLCDRDTTRRPQYFQNWPALEQHFNQEHYRCSDSECLEKKFIVFASEMDLKAHQLEEHPRGLSKTALRDMRKVDMSTFQDASSTAASSSSRGRGSRIQRDYRRDPQAPEPPPPPTDAGSLRRDEIAYQRTLAVQSAQSSTPQRMFGGQLTRPPTSATPPIAQPAATSEPPATMPAPTRQQERRAVAAQTDAFPPLSSLTLSATTAVAPIQPSTTSTVIRPVGDRLAQKHTAVSERAFRLLGADTGKLEKFKKYISNYNADSMTSKDLIEAFWVLFDVKAADLGILIRELAELFEKEDKRKALLASWNEWRSINEDYPPMPGASTSASQPSVPSTTNTARVLKLKSATSRNLHAGASPWSSVTSTTISNSAGSLANINGGARANPGRVAAGKAAVTPWAAAARNQGVSLGGSGARSNRSTASGSTSANVSRAEFPSLPAAAPRHPPIPRKNEGAAPTSVWSGSGGGAAGSGFEEYNPADYEVDASKKKGKKKQTIIQWG